MHLIVFSRVRARGHVLGVPHPPQFEFHSRSFQSPDRTSCAGPVLQPLGCNPPPLPI
ncbi:hypothetical protein AURDEDRAFT_178287 [Auricularia subglabra TFB-10046 SS5]|uniref:Uncharacterized protein n=1 Tax=Auricularia subglabra (strain TFB-10046 / SS5) TaxID=717982 RepID=J0WK07_AURST|nr:hypothetical protein AURDEDRAFT_178287 [Auricularia subglabra TFB-10046 SS5]